MEDESRRKKKRVKRSKSDGEKGTIFKEKDHIRLRVLVVFQELRYCQAGDQILVGGSGEFGESNSWALGLGDSDFTREDLFIAKFKEWFLRNLEWFH